VKLDPARTRLTVRTRVEGLLAAVAHSLELRAGGLRGELQEQSGRIEVPVAGLRVVGAIKHGRVDPDAPSLADKAEIERRIREVVFDRAERVEVAVALSGSRASFEVRAPHGSQRVGCALRREGARVSGTCTLSLAALGIAPVKLPLGTGRVADAVEVRFETELGV
jgi:hypothetical protein